MVRKRDVDWRGRIVLLALLAVAFAGCGGKETPPPRNEKTNEKTTQPATATQGGVPGTQVPGLQATQPASAPTTRPDANSAAATSPQVATEGNFRDKLAPALALEGEAEFAKALIEARKLKPTAQDPEDRRLLDETIARITEGRNQAYALEQAAERIGDTDKATAGEARRRLLQAGDVGRVFLRRALKRGSPAVAAAASEALAELRDPAAAAGLIARLEKEPRSDLTASILRDLRDMGARLENDSLRRCLKLIHGDAKLNYSELVAVLARYLDEGCLGSREKFNEAAGDAAAWERVRDYAERVMVGGSGEAVAYLCDFGGQFAGLMAGLRGRCYADRDFHAQTATRLDAKLSFGDRQIKFPDGRQDDLSVRWEGYLPVEKGGEYTFSLLADDSGVLYVDGQKVCESQSSWVSGKARLTVGLHPMHVDYVQDRDGSQAQLMWEGPGIAKTHDLPLSSPPWAECVKSAAAAVERLGSSEAGTVRAARRELWSAGDVGRVFLRRAAGGEADAAAIRATGVLVDWGDARALPVLLGVLADGKAGEDRTWATMGAAAELAANLEPAQLAALWKQAQADGEARMAPAAALLCAYADRACGGDARKLDDAVGQAGAAEKLKAYVAKALASKDSGVVARACALGQPFAPRMPGFRGRYYVGQEWDIPAAQRHDADVHVEDRKFPTGERQHDMSARWDAVLNADKEGDYTFFLSAATRAQVFIDGKCVDGIQGGEKGSVAKLTAGPHRIAVKHQNAEARNSSSSVNLDWQRPGGQRERLTGVHVSVAPWREHLEALSSAVRTLALNSEAGAGPGRRTLQAAGEVGRVYLRNAVRQEGEAVLAGVLRLLVDLHDAETAALLVDRLKAEPKLATAPVVADALTALADAIPAAELPGLWRAVKSDGQGQMIAQASALCTLMETQCGRSEAEFEPLVKDAAGGEGLRAYVAKCLVSPDSAVVARACQYGQPFAPTMNGLRMTVYDGSGFDAAVSDSPAGTVCIEGRRTPHPSQRQENISAQWNGLIRVEAGGKWTFRLGGDDSADLWIDGRRVLSAGPRWATATEELAAGLHAIRVDWSQTRDDGWVDLRAQGPGWSGMVRVPPRILFAPPWPGMLEGVAKAVKDMVGKQPKPSSRAALLDAGDVGAVYLRNVLRHETNLLALKSAVELLALQRDEQAAALMVAQLRGTADSLLARDILRALPDLAGSLSREDCRYLYRYNLPAGKPGGSGAGRARRAAGDDWRGALLCRLLAAQAGGDARKLGELVGDASAYEELRAEIEERLASRVDSQVAWALENGALLAPMRPGWRGKWFEGRTFGKALGETRDGQVAFGNRQLPAPGNRQDDVSAFWSGWVRTDKPGKHAFWLTADDGARLWVDGRRALDAWREQAGVEVSAEVELAAGAHFVEVAWWQGEGPDQAVVQWAGPGFARQNLDQNRVSTNVWAGELKAFEEIFRKLAGGDADRNWARLRLSEWGEAGRVLVRNALHYTAIEPLAAGAAEYLAAVKDPAAIELAAGRMAKATRADPRLVNVMLGAPDKIPADLPGKLLRLMGRDIKFEQRELVRLFAALFENVYKQDRDKLNTAMGNPKAYEKLAQYCDDLRNSPDGGMRSFGNQFGGQFVLPPKPLSPPPKPVAPPKKG